jgi:hypothetical protein
LLTEPGKEPFDIQIKGNSLFFIRENLVNVAEKKLPEDYEYISWIDAHLFFENPYVFQEAIVQLGKVNIVGPQTTIFFKDKANETYYYPDYSFPFMAFYHNSTPDSEKLNLDSGKTSIFPFYGLAYIANRDVFKNMEGLPDRCVAGVCDVYFSQAVTENYARNFNPEKPYGKWLRDYQDKASKAIERKFGYIKSNVFHFDHYWTLRKQSSWGPVGNRLIIRNFDPFDDLDTDDNGTLSFNKNNIELAFDFWKIYSAID